MIVYYVGLLLSLAIVTECQTEKPCTTDCKCCHENGKAYCCVVEDDEHDDRFPYWTLSYLAIPVIVALSIGLSCYCRYVRMKKIQEQLQQQRQPGEVIMMQDQPPPYPVTQQNSGLSNYSQGYTPTTSCVIGPNGYPVQQTEPFKQTAGSYPS